MAGTKARRVALWAGAVIMVLMAAVVGGGFFAAHEMKARVLEALRLVHPGSLPWRPRIV